jgi:exodeoxyribonuclease III
MPTCFRCVTGCMPGENVIITGDFNTAHMPIDLKNPKANAGPPAFMPEERAWVQKFLDHGFVDAYRFLYPEPVQYTWWTYISNARAARRRLADRLFSGLRALMPR